MTDAEKNELKRQLYEQTTMMLVSRGMQYSSVAKRKLEELYDAIDKGCYKNKYQVKLENIYIILEALKYRTIGLFSGNVPECVTDAIQLMIDIIESETDENA